MKKHIFISLIFTISFSCATTLSIDEQIEMIKKAPESKRVGLMNQFKRELILMNQEERASAIAQLKSDKKMSSPISTPTKQIIERVQSSAIEQSIQMSRDVAIREEIQQSIKIPNIPNTNIPSVAHPQQEIPNVQPLPTTPSQEMPSSQNLEPIEEHQAIPSTQTPLVSQPQEITDSQNLVPTEQPPETPNSQALPSTQSQEIPDTQTSTPTIESQGVSNTPIPNNGGI